MYVTNGKRTAMSSFGHRSDPDVPDPMAADDAADMPVLVTRRRLARIAVVASEVTARFVREGLDEDPVAWLFEPLPIFAGRSAIDAALDLEDCRRAVLLHGLGLDMTIGADCLDSLRDALRRGGDGSRTATPAE